MSPGQGPQRETMRHWITSFRIVEDRPNIGGASPFANVAVLTNRRFVEVLRAQLRARLRAAGPSAQRCADEGMGSGAAPDGRRKKIEYNPNSSKNKIGARLLSRFR